MVNKKLISILLIVLAICVVAAAATYILTNGSENTKNFECDAFTMKVPEKVNLIKTDAEENVTAYTDDVNLVNLKYIITDSVENLEIASKMKESIIVYDQVKNTNVPQDVEIYEHTDFESQKTIYTAIYNPNGIFVVIESGELDELLDMVKSIELKNIVKNETVDNKTVDDFVSEDVKNSVDSGDSRPSPRPSQPTNTESNSQNSGSSGSGGETPVEGEDGEYIGPSRDETPLVAFILDYISFNKFI